MRFNSSRFEKKKFSNLRQEEIQSALEEVPATVEEAEAELQVQARLEAEAKAHASERYVEATSRFGVGGGRYFLKRNRVSAKARQSGLKKAHDRTRTERVRERTLNNVERLNGRSVPRVAEERNDALANQNGNVLMLKQRESRL